MGFTIWVRMTFGSYFSLRGRLTCFNSRRYITFWLITFLTSTSFTRNSYIISINIYLNVAELRTPSVSLSARLFTSNQLILFSLLSYSILLFLISTAIKPYQRNTINLPSFNILPNYSLISLFYSYSMLLAIYHPILNQTNTYFTICYLLHFLPKYKSHRHNFYNPELLNNALI